MFQSYICCWSLIACLWASPVILYGDESFDDLREKAEQGMAIAQYNLGLRYYKGEGIVKNEAEAVKWYRKAADQGFAKAQNNLGLCYCEGYGIVKNEAEAVKWFLKAAKQGEAVAQNNLGNCYKDARGIVKNEAEAVKWYRKAAEQGDAKAQHNLGVCYGNGNGVVKNHVEAVKWWRKAAEQGHVLAQSNLGFSYENGEGVVKNHVEAVKWWRKAAEQGDAIAQYKLGNCYRDGYGIVKNDIIAYKWFLLSTAQGNQAAKKNMEIAEKKLTPEQWAEGQRLATEWQADFEKKQKWADNSSTNDRSTKYLIGKWEIRTYGYHFKADGTFDLFNPDDGSKLGEGTWSIKGNQLHISMEGKGQDVEFKIISKDEWEWIVTPDRSWQATRIN